jgi:hypothetical protein
MGQYVTGTVGVTNASPTVNGTGTSWLSLSTPLLFKVDEDGEAIYEVASITDDTTLVLSSNYGGTTRAGLGYQLVQDFSSNLGIPLPSQGDADAGDWLRRSIVEIDGFLNAPKLDVNIETLSANKTLTISSARLQFLNASGASRDVTLPAEASSEGAMFFIFETGGSYSLVVKDDSPATIVTIPANKAALLACSGVVWKGLLGT